MEVTVTPEDLTVIAPPVDEATSVQDEPVFWLLELAQLPPVYINVNEEGLQVAHALAPTPGVGVGVGGGARDVRL